jgi:hypothetical protein
VVAERRLGRPQALNVVWTLLVAYLVFGGHLFPVPEIK